MGEETRIIKANELATNLYVNQLKMNKEATEYLIDERGLTKPTLDYFKLGYADSSDAATRLLRQNDLPWQHLATLNGEHDYFRNRITIPVRLFGSTRMFTSRAFPTKIPIHLHQRGPRTIFFNEEKLVNSEYVFIVESPICAMTLHQNGVNAIAKYGASLSNTDKFDSNMRIYIVPDIEESRRGELDAMKVSSVLFSAGFRKIKILYLPQNGTKNDVNSFFREHDLEDFKGLASKAIPCTSQEDITVNIEGKERTFTWDDAIEEHLPKDKTKPAATSNLIKEIKSKVSLLKVVAEYAQIERLGGYSVCKCPLHGEKSPSFYIYTEKDDDHEDWYCYGCDRGGDVIEFIRQIEDVSFKVALDIIKNKIKEWSR